MILITYSLEDKGVHTFAKGISPKVNVIVRLEFELAYYDVAALHVNHCTTKMALFFFFKTVLMKVCCLCTQYLITYSFLIHSSNLVERGNKDWFGLI